MTKRRLFLFVTILCIFALVTAGLVACKRSVTPPSVETDGRVVPVATATSAVYTAVCDADGSVGQEHFTLTFAGNYRSGETVYNFAFNGAFDVSEINLEDDKRTQLSFEVKQGGNGIFKIYYDKGVLYLHFPPYADRAKIVDRNLAQMISEIAADKDGGAIKRIADTLPAIGNRIFTGCRLYSEAGTDRYVFTLSQARLFDVLSSFVEQWDAGFTPAEFLAALHLDEKTILTIGQSTATTTVEFSVKNGVFIGAKVETEGKGALTLTDFSLTGVTASVTMPAELSTYTEYDFENISLSGSLTFSTAMTKGERALNYDITANRSLVATEYPYTYEFKSHHVAGGDIEYSLTLKDKDDKQSRIDKRGEYLYVDFSAYHIGKFKVKATDLTDDVEALGFTDVDEYDFKDKSHLLALLVAGRSESNDVVTYTLGADFFSLFSEKIGFKGLFDVSGATLSWSKANNSLRDLAATVEVGSLKASLTSSTFTFGTPVTLSAVNEEEYYDVAAEDATARLHTSGTVAEQTSFASNGAFLSSVFSSISGEKITVAAEGAVKYEADLVYGRTGAVKRLYIRFYSASAEILKVYYTEETPDVFSLIYPAVSDSAGRYACPVRTCRIVEDPFSVFNVVLELMESEEGNKIALSSGESSVTIGLYPAMLGYLEEKIGKIYPDFSLSVLSGLNCARYDLKITKDALVGTVIFDTENSFVITANAYEVTFGKDAEVANIRVNVPQEVTIFAENDMPVVAKVSLGGTDCDLFLLDIDTGEKLWEYENAPTQIGKAGETMDVTASVEILGKTLSETIKVDISPATAVSLSGSAKYAQTFNRGTKTFTFDLYSDTYPGTVLASFAKMTVTAGGREYEKDVLWGSDDALKNAVNTTLLYRDNESKKRDFVISPKVTTYFGTAINLGDAARFTIHINGEKAVSTDYTVSFVAYDHRNPFDVSAYAEQLNVVTKSGERITAKHIIWDLDAATTAKAKQQSGKLYEYTTDPKNTDPKNVDKVIANVCDLMGYSVPIEVPIYFEKKVIAVPETFEGLPDGTTYLYNEKDKTGSFVFDVLKIRELSTVMPETALPTKLPAFPELDVSWEFDKVSSSALTNLEGKAGVVTLVVEDSISGRQTLTFSYQFTTASIKGTSLIAENGTTVARGIVKKSENIFEYEGTNLNVFTYDFPEYLRVTYKDKDDKDVSELLHPDWSIVQVDKAGNVIGKTFREEDLCKGGDYVLTGAAGSETVTVKLHFDKVQVTGYAFDAAELRTQDGDKIAMTDVELAGSKVKSLTYSALSVLDSRCSEQRTVALTDSKISVGYCDCNVFGTLLEAGAKANLAHRDSAEMSAVRVNDFDALATSFATLLGKYALSEAADWIPAEGSGQYASYAAFYEKAKALFATTDFTIPTYALSSGVIVGLTSDYSITTAEKGRLSHDELTAIVAKLFGYADADLFLAQATALTNVYRENAADASENSVADRLKYDGAIYTANGAFVLPYLCKNDTAGTSALVLVISDAQGELSVWISDVAAAKKVTNYKNDLGNRQEVSSEICGRCALFEKKMDCRKAENFPSEMMVSTDSGKTYVAVPVSAWDLSAVKEKSTLIGDGFFGTVTAKVKGLDVPVYVYVTPAYSHYDTAYFVDGEEKKSVLSFRLIEKEGAELVITDPRDTSNYPKTLLIESGLAGTSNEVRVLSWDIAEVVNLYKKQIKEGKDATAVATTEPVVVKAKIGNAGATTKEIVIEMQVEILASTIEVMNFEGIPFVASSEMTGGSTLEAINFIKKSEEGEDGKISYRYSVEMNPYYVNPQDADSAYPSVMRLLLNGEDVRSDVHWILDTIPANWRDEATSEYVVYATLDALGSSSPKIPVTVKIMALEIDKVWIDGSSQPNISINCYAENPFGGVVRGDIVTLDVQVQFKDDPYKYPLKLKYDKSGLLLSYDGSSTKDISIQVGNDSGGYRTIEGYTLRVISSVVSKIEPFKKNGDGFESMGVFYQRVDNKDGSIEITYDKVISKQSDVSYIEVTFGKNPVAQKIYLYTDPTKQAGGLVFDWERNVDGHLGVVLWNARFDLDADSAYGTRQAVYNPKQTEYDTVSADLVFKTDTQGDVIPLRAITYRDDADNGGALTPEKVLAHYAEDMRADIIKERYQSRYITTTEDPTTAISDGTVLNAGRYFLCIDIVGDSRYKGKVSTAFTIEPKDISDQVKMLVNNAVTRDGGTKKYSGSDYTVRVTSGDYLLSVDLQINGKDTETVRDVKYADDKKTVLAYEFVVSVKSDGNYTVDKTLSLTIEEIAYPDSMPISVLLTWNGGKKTFGVQVSVAGGDRLKADESLTNGYTIEYYSQDSYEEKDKVTVLEAGTEYYYKIKIKQPNYVKTERQGSQPAAE